MRSLTLTQAQLQQMILHVDLHAPLEACGLLAGLNSKVEAVLEVANQAQSPVQFLMDPIGQWKAFEWIESNGLELLGIFHSHPAGPTVGSPTDLANAAYAVVHIILSRVDGPWRARAFFIEDGAFSEVLLQIL